MRPIFTSLPRCALFGAVVLAVTAAQSAQSQNARRPAAPSSQFTVVEASIDDMRKALEQKRTTSREIVQQYLARIALYEDRLHAIITVNPRALAIADSLDRERARGTNPRSAARHSRRAQGQHPHDDDADDRRRARVRRSRAAVRGDAHEESQGRRRDHHREDAAHRARELGRERNARATTTASMATA